MVTGYTMINVTTKTDVSHHTGNDAGRLEAINHCDAWQRHDPAGEYVVIEKRIVHRAVRAAA